MRGLLFVLTLGIAWISPLPAQHGPAGAASASPRGPDEWRPGAVAPGSMAMLLLGNPTRHEMFAARFRDPDGARIAPHWHTTTVHVTVLSGTFVVGMGAAVDSTQVERSTAPAASWCWRQA